MEITSGPFFTTSSGLIDSVDSMLFEWREKREEEGRRKKEKKNNRMSNGYSFLSLLLFLS